MTTFARSAETPVTDRERLATLFEAHQRRLFLLARRMVGDPEESRDVVQEVFVRAAHARLPGDPGACEAWLVRTTVNACRDRRRRERVRRLARARLAEETAADPAVQADPDQALRRAVTSALAALPPRQRAVVVLHELEDRDIADVARLLGISRVTVRWHLAAARRRLADALAGWKEYIR